MPLSSFRIPKVNSLNFQSFHKKHFAFIDSMLQLLSELMTKQLLFASDRQPISSLWHKILTKKCSQGEDNALGCLFLSPIFRVNRRLKRLIGTSNKNIDDSFRGFSVPEFRNFALLTVSVKNPNFLLKSFLDRFPLRYSYLLLS
jgi:hypothetical protein